MIYLIEGYYSGRATIATNNKIMNEKNDWIVITTSITYFWSFVTQIFVTVYLAMVVAVQHSKRILQFRNFSRDIKKNLTRSFNVRLPYLDDSYQYICFMI
jgi:hypothetical protein